MRVRSEVASGRVGVARSKLIYRTAVFSAVAIILQYLVNFPTQDRDDRRAIDDH